MTDDNPLFGDTRWCRALTLAERVELVRRPGASPRGDRELAERRLGRWRSRRPFDDDEVFAAWLEANGRTERELLAAFAETPDDLAGLLERPPAWWAELGAAYGEPVRPDAPPFPPEDPERPDTQVLRLFRPLVVRGADRVHAAARTLAEADPDAPFDPGRAVALLLSTLSNQLFEMSVRTLILELNVARLRGELHGETGAKRFRSFVERLESRSGALEVLAEYPVLARLAVAAVDRWARFSIEFLGHLAVDREDLQARLAGGRALGRLRRLRGWAGDMHQEGRSVQILELDSGMKLVYKPRPLAVDRHLRELLDWLNERGDHPPLRAPELLDRGSHGWMEFVEAEPCATEAEIERFYERQGGFLALLYLLDASDFHFENLIASGEHPVLVDVESLFAQRIRRLDRESALGQATEAVVYSVLRTGLLPRIAWADEGYQGIDYSGLGAEAGQLNPAVPAPEAGGTDAMRMARKQTRFEGGNNRPTLNGEAVRLSDFAPAVRRGFESVYRTLGRHREELTATGGPLAAFAEDRVRVILRPTQTYRLLLLDGYHPDLLRDALDRDRHLDRLWSGARDRPEARFVAPAEREELARLDIPVFWSCPGRRELYSGTGRSSPEHFDDTGLEVSLDRLRRAGAADLELQSWMIGASLASMDNPLLRAAGEPPPSLDGREPAGREALLAAAGRIRQRLGELAFRGADGEVSWVGIAATDERHFAPSAAGADLYSGLPGIALFLAYAAEARDDAEARSLAEAAWRTLRHGLERDLGDIREIGAFTGLGGLIHTATHLGVLWDRPEILELAEEVASALLDRLEADRTSDLMSGAAGCIPILLALGRATGRPGGPEAALRCGEHVLRTAREMPRGIGWTSPQTGDRPLSGLSHGAAGIAWSLLTLAREAGDERFLRAARGAVAYERTLFDPERGNWRDLRPFLGPEGSFNVAWCHGAVGIALARMASLELEPDEAERREMRREIEVALETVRRSGFGFDHSLCHGAMGTIELLDQAGRRLGEASDARRARQAAAAVCQEVEAGRFHCGVPGGFETPGLMDGLAGIGYGLIRLAAPHLVPSVLVLEPPRRLAAEEGEPAAAESVAVA